MPRFFVPSENFTENEIKITGEDAFHIARALRMAVGDALTVCDMHGAEYSCTLSRIRDEECLCQIISKAEGKTESPLFISLYMAYPKGDKIETVTLKAVELGVSEIIPLNASRSIVKLDKKENKKANRWEKILKEASEQSKRVVIPKLNEIMDIKDLTKLDYDYKILCTVNEISTSIKNVLPSDLNNKKILFVIGPEGGFTDKEEQILIDNGFISTSFGRRVLRTETASLYALSIINYIEM